MFNFVSKFQARVSRTGRHTCVRRRRRRRRHRRLVDGSSLFNNVRAHVENGVVCVCVFVCDDAATHTCIIHCVCARVCVRMLCTRLVCANCVENYLGDGGGVAASSSLSERLRELTHARTSSGGHRSHSGAHDWPLFMQCRRFAACLCSTYSEMDELCVLVLQSKITLACADYMQTTDTSLQIYRVLLCGF